MHPTRKYFYCDTNDEYHFVNRTLVRKTENGIKEILEFEDLGLEEKSYSVIFLLEFEKYRVLMFDWAIPRNAVCLRRETDKVVWRIDAPKKWGGEDSENYWLIMGVSKLYREAVVCDSYQNYRATFDLETKKILWEKKLTSNDPRDF